MTDLEAAAYELVTEFGAPAVYSSSASREYVPGGDVSVTKVDSPVTAVLLDLTLQSNGLSLKYGTEILTGDKEAYMLPPANPIKINPGSDKLTFAGIQYTVVTFKEINPSGTKPYVYMLYLRR